MSVQFSKPTCLPACLQPAQGTIMMVNNATLGLFGYQKGELEGKNVSVLM